MLRHTIVAQVGFRPKLCAGLVIWGDPEVGGADSYCSLSTARKRQRKIMKRKGNGCWGGGGEKQHFIMLSYDETTAHVKDLKTIDASMLHVVL